VPAIDLDDARAEHGRLIRVDLRGREYVFRPMALDEAQRVAERLDAAPEVALSTAIAAVRECYLATQVDDGYRSDTALFEEAAENFPLAFSAERGVCARLLRLASEQLADQVKEAISRWRGSERQLGSIAEDLLAFKEHQGGQASAKALAGALHVAEGLDTLKGLYKLHLSFMRALGKRRG